MGMTMEETATTLRNKLAEIGADIRAGASLQQPATLVCTACHQAMRVAPEHMRVVVACPHCGLQLEPRNIAAQSCNMPADARRRGAASGTRSWRNRWVAGILGVLLGAFGVHRFYLGYTGIGVLQIVLTICTAGIAGVWGFIEGVLCLVGSGLRDIDGLPLRD